MTRIRHSRDQWRRDRWRGDQWRRDQWRRDQWRRDLWQRDGLQWWESRRRSRSRRERAVGPAVVAGIIQVAGCSLADGTLPRPALVLLLLGPFALLFRELVPVPVLMFTAALTVLYFAGDYPSGPAFVAAILALVAAVRAGWRWTARATLLAGYVAYLWLVDVSLARAIGIAAWGLVAYGVAEGSRFRGAHFAAMARARAEEERAAEEQQRRQASDERLRIARELHDVLGHHLSLINVQAGVGLHLMDERPEQARAALAAIKQASAEALREVRSVLAALRPDSEAAPRTPAPGLADVGELVAAAGLPVRLETTGTVGELPPEVDRAAYRIAQEALTNVRRHAGPDATAELVITYRPDALEVRISDDGGGGAVGPGNGIAGMRERAVALGGTLRAGPRDGGGFDVVAELPRNGGDG